MKRPGHVGIRLTAEQAALYPTELDQLVRALRAVSGFAVQKSLAVPTSVGPIPAIQKIIALEPVEKVVAASALEVIVALEPKDLVDAGIADGGFARRREGKRRAWRRGYGSLSCSAR